MLKLTTLLLLLLLLVRPMTAVVAMSSSPSTTRGSHRLGTVEQQNKIDAKTAFPFHTLIVAQCVLQTLHACWRDTSP